MPEYLAPGVYTEEISSGPVPIEGVSTSTAGFVGPTRRGPVQPRLITSWLDFQRWYGGLAPEGDRAAYTSWAVKGFFDNGGRRLFMARAVPDRSVPASLTLNGQSRLTLTAAGPGALTNQLWVAVKDPSAPDPRSAANPRPRDPNRVRIQIALYETPYPYTPFVDPTDPANVTNPNRREPDVFEDYDDVVVADIETVLLGSALVRAGFQPNQAPVRPTNAPFAPLTQGSDGAGALTPQNYLGAGNLAPENRTGLEGIKTIDEVSILVVPDQPIVATLDGAIRTQCELLRDRFGILSTGRDVTDVNNVMPPFTSSYVALYFPWVRVMDPVTQATLLVPPAGHVAGVYAATDVDRGVHKAPANVDLRGIVTQDLPGNRKPLAYMVSKGDQDVLNPRGVNCTRDFRSDRRGIRVWGARTLADNAQWKYVPVRRLFIFVEESVDEGTQWVVFEPNDEFTWARVRRSIENFLTSVWRSGALVGATPDEAFQVRCDRTTMTPDDIDNGRLVCLIGMAPVKPAEFVILRFSQRTADAPA
jgi:phage tail sheath protein FI